MKSKQKYYMPLMYGQIAGWCEKDERFYFEFRRVDLKKCSKSLREHRSRCKKSENFYLNVNGQLSKHDSYDYVLVYA